VVATVVATAEGGVLGESNRQLAAASDQNTKLVNALAEPRQQITTLKEEVHELSAPAGDVWRALLGQRQRHRQCSGEYLTSDIPIAESEKRRLGVERAAVIEALIHEAVEAMDHASEENLLLEIT
jgi:hypothetical protein